MSRPGRIPGSRTAHAGLEDPNHAVALEEQGEARDVVFVRMAEDDDVDAAIPRRDPTIQGDQQAVGIGPAVDQQTPSARSLDQDRIALADVEDRDPGEPRRSCSHDAAGDHGRDDQRPDPGAPREPPRARRGGDGGVGSGPRR
jgi:hypothetical protein